MYVYIRIYIHICRHITNNTAVSIVAKELTKICIICDTTDWTAPFVTNSVNRQPQLRKS